MAVKDRTSLFIDRDPFKLSIQTGEEFRKWLETGIDPRKAEMEREQAAQKARDDLYESYLKRLDSVKNSETLKIVYEDLKNDAKILGSDYTKDLTDRIKSIKEEIEKNRQEQEMKQQPKNELMPIEPTPEPAKKDETLGFVVTKEATKKFMETTRAIRVAPNHDTLLELMAEFFADLADKITPEMKSRVEAVAEERLKGLTDEKPAVIVEMEDGPSIEETTPEVVQSEESAKSEPEVLENQKTYKETIKANGDIVRK